MIEGQASLTASTRVRDKEEDVSREDVVVVAVERFIMHDVSELGE